MDLDQIQTNVDTIVRDEAYAGDGGPLNERQFNQMAARIASEVMDMLKREGVL